MQVTVEIVCRAIFNGFAGAPVEVEEGATVQDAVVACCAQGGLDSIDNRLDHILCMVNEKTVQLDENVEDGDRIHVLHKIMGG